MSNEQELIIINYLKNTPNVVLCEVCEKFGIGNRVLERIRKSHGLYDGFTKHLSKEQRSQILEFMRNNPLMAYHEMMDIFGATYKQLVKIRGTDKSLPNLMKSTKRKKNNSYLTPELETRIVSYMRDNVSCNHEDLMVEFNCSIRQVERLRTENNFPPIKRRPATTHQSILRKEGKRYCPKCDTIKLLEYFSTTRPSCCLECDTIRSDERIGVGDLEKFLTVKIKQSRKRINIQNDLEISNLLDIHNRQSGKCFYSGRPLELKKDHPHSLSIDRINSKLGYTMDNVVLCCSIVNYMKQEYDCDLFLKLCNEISRSHPLE